MQRACFQILDGAVDDRIIYWIQDVQGGLGKSQFMKNYGRKNPKTVVAVDNTEGKNIKFICAQHIKKYHMLRVIMIGLARADTNKVCYSTIEGLKDAHYTTTKYQCEIIDVLQPPHVIIFSNTGPDLTGLTMNRWRVGTLRGVDESIAWQLIK